MTVKKPKGVIKSVMPKSVPFPAGAYTVVEAPGLAVSKKEYGNWDYDSRTFTIDTAVAPDVQRVTLEHEKVHAILGDANLRLPYKMEEAVCEAIAKYRVFEMQQPCGFPVSLSGSNDQ